MRRISSVLAVSALALSLAAWSASAGEKKVIEKTFDRPAKLSIETVLGGCTIEKGGSEVTVRVEYSYDDKNFEAKFRVKGDRLYLEENIEGDDVDGESHWKITVPDGIEIEFESATGSLRISGLSGEIECSSGTGRISVTGFSGEADLSSGTGDIELKGSKGDFEATSGTGDLLVEKCRGDFDLSSGTGKIRARDFEVESSGEFSSGTGKAMVELPEGPDYSLEISSGTGDAHLDCAGRDLDAYVEMKAGLKSGRIRSSFDFDGEEQDHRDDGNSIVKKFLTSGSGARKIRISTGTGTARLEK